jgi:hypothetical protein
MYQILSVFHLVKLLPKSGVLPRYQSLALESVTSLVHASSRAGLSSTNFPSLSTHVPR